MLKVKTRFAVSPTGYLHVGGVRNALFDWLVARQAGGEFILRIEDTDQAREVKGAVEHITETLKCLGLNWDGEPVVQSERLAIYKQWAQKLIEAGRAYADPYSPEEVQKFREQAQKNKQPFLYRNHRPANPPAWDGSQALRFKSEPKVYKWQDEVLGELAAGEEAVDDFILIKSDGFPTYNFCHIVDDILMDITYVIRSQEFIASVPKYLNLYEALGEQPPIMATLPFIMGPDGKKKLAKRDGAKDVLDYIRGGYLPDALVNFIASLGWNDGTEQEIFSRDELIKKFKLSQVGRSGAKFDEQRLNWMNGHYIREMPLDELYEKAKDFWPASAAQFDNDYKKKVLGLVQERLKFLAELPELTEFFFTDLPVDKNLIASHKKLGKMEPADLKTLLETARNNLAESDFSAEDLTNRLNGLLGVTHTQPVILFSLIRIATTEAPASPGLAETLAVLGKERSLKRLDRQIAAL